MLGALLGAAGCAASGCPPGFAAATVADLHFGLGEGHSPAAGARDTDWQLFVAEVVTPAFPAGLTAWAASGQWRDEGGAIIREPARVLRLVLPDTNPSAAARRIAPVVGAGKARLDQRSVLVTLTRACSAF